MVRARGRPDRRMHNICRQLNAAVRNGQYELALALSARVLKQRRATPAHVYAALTPATRQFINQTPSGVYL